MLGGSNMWKLSRPVSVTETRKHIEINLTNANNVHFPESWTHDVILWGSLWGSVSCPPSKYTWVGRDADSQTDRQDMVE